MSVQLKAFARKIFYATSMLLCLSCEREAGTRLIVDPINPVKTQGTEEAYLHLHIYRPNAIQLRSTRHDPMTSVSSIMLLFYNQSSGLLQDIKEFSLVTSEELSRLRVKLRADDYQLVVLANVTNELRAFLNKGSHISLLSSGVVLRSSELFNMQSDNVVMSNEQGSVTILKSQFTNTQTATTSIGVKIEPSLSRVLVFGTPELRGGRQGKAPIKYTVNNLPNKVCVLRQMARLSTGEMEQAGDQSLAQQRYAKTPMWEFWGEVQPNSTEGIGVLPVPSLNALSMSYVARHSVDDFLSLPSSDIPYCKESTLPPTAYLRGLVPYVHIAFPYIPNDLQLADNEGWLSYRGRHYTEQEAKVLLNRPDRDNPLSNALHNAGVTVRDFEQGFEKGGISFYHKGYSYYTVFVKHFGVTEQADRYGLYGLVRGNEYRIQITHVHNPGSPIPISYENDLTPIEEPSQSDLSVSIQSVTRREQLAEL